VVHYPLFEYPPYSLSLASKMAEVVEFTELDLLHVHYAIPHATSAYLAREMLKRYDIKVVTTLHGTDITLIGSNPSFIKIAKFSIEQSDGVTSVSDYLRDETKNIFKIQKPIQVIPNFIPDDFKDHPASVELRHQCCNEDEKIITHISNFRPLKRVHELVDVMEKIADQSKVKLLMVGDGPERAAVERKCKEKKLCQSIEFLGKQENVADILAISDLFILPSENESFGLAALEAMACGVPCITSNAGGLTEVNIDGETGFVCEVGDIEAYAASVLKLINDTDLRQKFSQNALKISQQKFNADRIVQQYIDYYNKILNR
ncbi:MAG: N-acetyl-alpha-D-glucosaminyl L-malate synthase BshA, partial [Caldithrix sp.]|nr:N-acetyl-alpha-D-glucosaminyl L-malate synthase BshA [Caldithrix sp.]